MDDQLAKQMLELGLEQGGSLKERDEDRFNERHIAQKVSKVWKDKPQHDGSRESKIIGFSMSECGGRMALLFSVSAAHVTAGPPVGFSPPKFIKIPCEHPVHIRRGMGPELDNLENEKNVKELFNRYIDFLNNKIDHFKDRIETKSTSHNSDELEIAENTSMEKKGKPMTSQNNASSFSLVAVIPSILNGLPTYNEEIVVSVIGTFDDFNEATEHGKSLSEDRFPDVDILVVASGEWVDPADLGSSHSGIPTIYTGSKALEEHMKQF